MFVILDSKISHADSFGIVGYQIYRALKKLGHRVNVTPWPESDKNIELQQDQTLGTPDLFLRFSHPDGPFSPDYAEKSIVLTVFETTRLYARTNILNIRGVGAYACPSTHCVNILSSLIPDPVHLFHHGISLIKPPKTHISKNKRLKVLMVGLQEIRKHSEDTFRIFDEYFGNDPRVELMVKAQEGFIPETQIKSNNIKFISKTMDRNALEDLYLDCDFFIMPSKAEGFGLTGLEAAGFGLPIITTGWSGQMDYVDDCASLLIDYKLEQIPQELKWRGEWAVPDEEDFVSKINYALDNLSLREEAIEKASSVRERWSWVKNTEKFLESVK